MWLQWAVQPIILETMLQRIAWKDVPSVMEVKLGGISQLKHVLSNVMDFYGEMQQVGNLYVLVYVPVCQ